MCAASSQGIDLDRFAVARNLSKSGVADAAHRASTVVAKTAGAGTAVAREIWEQAKSGIVKAIAGPPRRRVGQPRNLSRPTAGDSGLGFRPGAVRGGYRRPRDVRHDRPRSGPPPADGPPDRPSTERRGPLGQNLAAARSGSRTPAVGSRPGDQLENAPPDPGAIPRQVGPPGTCRPSLPKSLHDSGHGAAIGGNRRAGGCELTQPALHGAHVPRCDALGRNLTIEVLEFFDRSGFTRRIGDERTVLKPAADAFESRDARQAEVG